VSVQITDELRVLVEAEVASAIENMRKLDDSVEKTEKQANKLDDALKSLEKKALILSAAVAGAGGAAVKFAADNEKLRTSLEVLLGSAEQAGAVFEEWKRFGAATPLSVEEIASAGKSLLAFGIDAEEVTGTMRRLGDVAQGIGARLGDVADVYGKARVQGRLFSNDINQFQGRGIPIVQALAKALGTTEGAIKELVAQGKVGFPELEQAFKIMTENGGQFEGMMDRLSQTTAGKFSSAMDNARQAAASFGELLLPLVNDVLDSVTDLMGGIANMDDGTKRFILGFGGIVAISGPAIAAIKGVNAALAAMAANPYIALVGGLVAATGAAVGWINKQSHAYEDLVSKMNDTRAAADGLLDSFADGNTAKQLDRETVEELIRLYPRLTDKIREHNTTVADAARLVKAQHEAEAINAASKEISRALTYETNLKIETDPLQIRALHDMIDAAYSNVDKILAPTNYRRMANSTVFEHIPEQKPEPETTEAAGLPPSGSAAVTAKKRWQEWYSEITKVDIAAVNRIKDQGEALGSLFVSGLEDSLTLNLNVAEVLGKDLEKDFDLAGALRGQRDEIERALTELLSISPSEIDDPFEFRDKFIDPLSEKFKKLSEEIRDADFADAIEDLQKKLDDYGKSERQLAEEEAALNGFLPEQAAEIAALSEEYARLSWSMEDLIGSTLAERFPEASAVARESIAGIAASLAEVSFDHMLQGLEDVGYALAQNKDAAGAFKAAMASMIRSMMDMLPTLFLEAGLRLIISGQWPMGLAFIAMAASSSLINGYTKGLTEDADESARGNVFDGGGMTPYRRGGAFTGQVVTGPTYFRHGGGLGLMGEAGPEAVMPLKRLGNGDLGVEASGLGGTRVIVTIYNNSGEPATQEEQTDQDGNRKIDIMIGELVSGQISQGRHDAAIESRFEGLSRRGR
jgi:tape measure domain-containing protein